jgi:hypothetical protein
VFGRHTEVGNLGGFDEDVFALAVLVPFDDLIFLDGRGGLTWILLERGGEDFLMTNALASGAADLVEADLAFGFGGDKEFHPEGDERDLNVTGPVWTRQGTYLAELTAYQQMIEIRSRTVKMYVVEY